MTYRVSTDGHEPLLITASPSHLDALLRYIVAHDIVANPGGVKWRGSDSAGWTADQGGRLYRVEVVP